MNIVELIKENKKILVCGEESSGKTRFLKELIKEFVSNELVLVLSNRKELIHEVSFPENLEFVYKSRDIEKIDVEFLETEAKYIFIDEKCENKEEIFDFCEDKHVVLVKTIENESIDSLMEFYDVILEVKKNDLGNPKINKIYKK